MVIMLDDRCDLICKYNTIKEAASVAQTTEEELEKYINTGLPFKHFYYYIWYYDILKLREE